jgi:hypothetical protein
VKTRTKGLQAKNEKEYSPNSAHPFKFHASEGDTGERRQAPGSTRALLDEALHSAPGNKLTKRGAVACIIGKYPSYYNHASVKDKLEKNIAPVLSSFFRRLSDEKDGRASYYTFKTEVRTKLMNTSMIATNMGAVYSDY